MNKRTTCEEETISLQRFLLVLIFVKMNNINHDM